MSLTAPIIEIFSSYQGEGPHVGERHLFVRFQDCELSCKFCDTPQSFVENRFCRIEQPPFSKKFQNIPNPISSEDLTRIVSDFQDPVLVLTGGEPLQKASFLREWLPGIHGRFKILLETAGIHFSEFRDIASWIDIISMDFKLPSVTGMHPWWREHASFLKAVKEDPKRELYIKMVISNETEEKDISRALELLRSIDVFLPVILQPASLFGRFRNIPTIDQVAHWQEILQTVLPNVRVIPQVHRHMGIL